MPPTRSVTAVPASEFQSRIAPRRSAAPGSAFRTISDEDLQRHILVRLSKLGPRVSRNVRAHVRRGEVQLSGTIGSEYERQFILHVIGQVAGIRHLTDAISIREEQPGPAPSRIPELPALAVTRSHACRAGWVAAGVALLIGFSILHPWSWMSGPAIVAIPATMRVAGQPAAGALLVLHPLSRNGAKAIRPQGRVVSDGTIEWATYDRGDGVPPGDYVVTAVWNRTVLMDGEMKPGENVLADCYSRPETSPLRICVSADQSEPLCLDMPL